MDALWIILSQQKTEKNDIFFFLSSAMEIGIIGRVNIQIKIFLETKKKTLDIISWKESNWGDPVNKDNIVSVKKCVTKAIFIITKRYYTCVLLLLYCQMWYFLLKNLSRRQVLKKIIVLHVIKIYHSGKEFILFSKNL